MTRRKLIALGALVALLATAGWWLSRPRTLLSTLDDLSADERIKRIMAMTPAERAQLDREQDDQAEQRLAEGGSRWSGSRISVSRMDDSTEAWYENAATDQIGLRPVRPEMVVRCEDGKTRVWINTRLDKASDESKRQSVRLRFDDAAPMSADWWPTTNGVGERALVPEDSMAVLTQVFAAKTLLFEFSVEAGGRHLMTFDVRGLRERIVAELERENRNRRLMAEIEKKPVPVALAPPCDWVAAEAKGK